MARVLVQPTYPGRTDGTAVPAGNIGKIVENVGVFTCGTAPSAASGSWGNIFSQSMEGGLWEVFASVSNTTGGITANALVISDVGTVAAAVPADALEGGLNFGDNNNNATEARLGGVTFNKGSNWTLYICVRTAFSSGSIRVQFRAVKIG